MGYRPRAQADGCLMRTARVDRDAATAGRVDRLIFPLPVTPPGSSYSEFSASARPGILKTLSNDRAASPGDRADGTSVTVGLWRSGSFRGAPLSPRTTAVRGVRPIRHLRPVVLAPPLAVTLAIWLADAQCERPARRSYARKRTG